MTVNQDRFSPWVPDNRCLLFVSNRIEPDTENYTVIARYLYEKVRTLRTVTADPSLTLEQAEKFMPEDQFGMKKHACLAAIKLTWQHLMVKRAIRANRQHKPSVLTLEERIISRLYWPIVNKHRDTLLGAAKHSAIIVKRGADPHIIYAGHYTDGRRYGLYQSPKMTLTLPRGWTKFPYRVVDKKLENFVVDYKPISDEMQHGTVASVRVILRKAGDREVSQWLVALQSDIEPKAVPLVATTINNARNMLHTIRAEHVHRIAMRLRA